MTPEQIAQMKADMADGTPGPWLMCQDEEGPPATCITAGGFDIATAWGGYNAAVPDARRIARVPDLEAEILMLRAENARLRAVLADCLTFLELDCFHMSSAEPERRKARAALNGAVS
jgi:hypothetical protein